MPGIPFLRTHYQFSLVGGLLLKIDFIELLQTLFESLIVVLIQFRLLTFKHKGTLFIQDLSRPSLSESFFVGELLVPSTAIRLGSFKGEKLVLLRTF